MSILIAGCGGIGKKLVPYLQNSTQAQAELHTLARNLDLTGWAKQYGCQHHVMDLDAAIQPAHIPYCDTVIYLAPPAANGDLSTDNRIANFLQALASRPPANLIYISTSGVYGDCRGAWVDEKASVRATIPRSLRRISAEQQCKAFAATNSVRLVILRVPSIYGAGRLPQKRLAQGTPIVRKEDAPWSNRIYDEDLVRICALAINNATLEGVYNVADDQPSTMFDYFTAVATHLGLPQPPAISLVEAEQQLSAGMLSYMRESRRIDNSRMKREFGITLLAPTLAQGLALISV